MLEGMGNAACGFKLQQKKAGVIALFCLDVDQ